MSLYKKLTAARLAADLSQLEVAEALDVSRQAISRWEQGLGSPTADNLKKLSALYHVSVDYLLHDEIEDPMQMVGIPPFKPEAEKNPIQSAEIPSECPESEENRSPEAQSYKRKNSILMIACISILTAAILLCAAVTLKFINNNSGSEPELREEIETEDVDGSFSIVW